MPSGTMKVKYLSSYDSWKVTGGPHGSGDTYKDTKKAAVNAAKTLARRNGMKVKVYKQNGSLQDTFDYSDNTTSSSGGLFGF